jgi:xylulokinase
MFSLGIDLGSSSVKVSLLDIEAGKVTAAAQSPETEMPIHATKPGFAEQDPSMWWKELSNAIQKLFSGNSIKASEVKCIGISYQMHGLVMLDQAGKVIRPSIIWCDSRAVETGNKISQTVGERTCYTKLLNLPGNFTASKLKWVKDNEPGNYSKCSTVMLPGDWIAYQMTGEISTTATGLSEGTLWDFEDEKPAGFLLDKVSIEQNKIPSVVSVFGIQGKLRENVARELGLPSGIPVTYRAGDQPNNAFSLNVLEPGEVAATAGTSGVVYAVTDRFRAESAEGVNGFAHVNHDEKNKRLGILLCINGTGIANSWIRKITGANLTYPEMNDHALKIKAGSDGVSFIPFGNGAERMLGNREPGASIHGINFNIHTFSHIFRAVQEGIAFSFYYGMKKMGNAGVKIHTLKAGKANLFQSQIFTSTLATLTNSQILLYDTDGAAGAARGAALGAGYYKSSKDCFSNLMLIGKIEPEKNIHELCIKAYHSWEKILLNQL